MFLVKHSPLPMIAKTPFFSPLGSGLFRVSYATQRIFQPEAGNPSLLSFF